jgi:hypothetical protein
MSYSNRYDESRQLESRLSSFNWLQSDLRLLGGLSARRTNDVVLKSQSLYHEAIRQLPGRRWQRKHLPIDIKDFPTALTDRMIVVLRRSIHPHAITGTRHSAAKAIPNKDVKRLIDGGQG